MSSRTEGSTRPCSSSTWLSTRRRWAKRKCRAGSSRSGATQAPQAAAAGEGVPRDSSLVAQGYWQWQPRIAGRQSEPWPLPGSRAWEWPAVPRMPVVAAPARPRAQDWPAGTLPRSPGPRRSGRSIVLESHEFPMHVTSRSPSLSKHRVGETESWGRAAKARAEIRFLRDLCRCWQAVTHL